MDLLHSYLEPDMNVSEINRSFGCLVYALHLYEWIRPRTIDFPYDIFVIFELNDNLTDSSV